MFISIISLIWNICFQLTKTTTKKAKTHLKASQSPKRNKPQLQHSEDDVSTEPEDESNTNSSPVLSSDCSLTDTASDTAIISQSKLQSLLTHTSSKPSRNISRHKTDNKDRKNVTEKSAPAKPSATSRGTVKVPKPISSAKLQYRTSSSEIGKYSSVNNKKPPSGASRRTLQKQREQNPSNVRKPKQPVHRSQSVESQPADKKKLTRSMSEERKPKPLSSTRVIKSAESKLPDRNVQSSSARRSDLVMGDVEEGVDRMRIQVSSSDANGKQEEDENMPEAPPPFLLKKDGYVDLL